MIPTCEKSTQVLVVGGGPAGFSAALTAARGGAQVVLLEQSGDIGGISTSGLMSHWTGSCGSPLYREILKRSAERNEGDFRDKITSIIDPEKLKTLYLDMLTEAGVEILLYTFAVDALMEGDILRGVEAVNKSGRLLIRADVVIDASGDGDIAARSGAEFTSGREEDGKMQPATVMFKVGGVDTKRAVFPGSFESKVQTEKGELQALAREKLPHPAGHVLLYRSTLPGVVTCNMTNAIGIDGTEAADLVRGTLICRRQMEKIVDFLREYVPGYEACYIISSASLLGIRETRHFAGRYTLTEEDILASRVFDDWVVWDAKFNFDVHNLSGAGLDVTGSQHKFPKISGYTIPYGCLLPARVRHLLLSGRNISGTHIAHSNFRVMPICVGIGEAGGAAAAIAVRRGAEVSEISAEEIRAAVYGA